VGTCKGREVGGREFKWHLSGNRGDTLLHENKSGINKLDRTDTSALLISDSELKY